MKRLAREISLSLGSLALLSFPADAQLFRAYVASFGSDANPCSVTQPCRLIPAALAVIASGGEIWMLDSANFNSGTVNIDKSATIKAVPGQVGSIVAVGGAPAINMGAVALRLQNVAIGNNAVNPGTDGIVMASGGDLQVQDSLISVPNLGINATGGRVSVHDTVVRDCFSGVVIRGSGTGDISRSKFAGNNQYAILSDGSLASETPFISVTDTEIAHGFVGILAYTTTAGSGAKMVARNVNASHMQYAAVAFVTVATGTAYLSVSGSSFSDNDIGLYQSGAGATLESMGNNHVKGNNNDTVGSITPGSLR